MISCCTVSQCEISDANYNFPGTKIYQLERSEMGCVDFPVWIGIVTGTVILGLIIITIVINRKWEAIKFILFMKYNILFSDDEPENVDEMEFDAFIAYR